MFPMPDAGQVAACQTRRTKLSAALGDRTAVIPAGRAQSRNYPDNVWPFRASSHFLYLVGAPVEGATLVIDGQGATLFAHDPGPEDELWHGPEPDLTTLSELLGVETAPVERLADRLKDQTVGVLGTVHAGVMAELGALAQVDPEHTTAVAETMIGLRLIHDEAALAELERSAAITVEGHIAGMAATRPGLHAWAVKAAMEGVFARAGMGTAYGSIVSPQGEVLHNPWHHHVLGEADLLLADVGAEGHGGWAADVTRTWPVSGRFSPTQKALYSIVLESQHKAIEAAQAGVRYRDVHLTACRVLTEGLVDVGILKGDVDGLIEDDVHALFFPHGVGHIIGLDVHDMEDLGDQAGYAPGRERSKRFGLGYLRLDRDLAPGMAVTIEPGLYLIPALLRDPARTAAAGDRLNRERLAEFSDVRGIRIEDDVVIQAEGPPRVLTEGAPKSIEAVEALVGRDAERL